ncbi:type II toxin-antitoxin system VapC family toxin [Bosea sp. (in: a-proteobacteria)]|uniref:type II toxin-antitoxin system VapC family toxin n=1 Tax=Bosea sp. (in: a-proteobacteria) TaxID=1871050 RepID=UPI00262B5187|nr:type II toxin-antitoxin system VapC family toxin [Bosea sp. (in: a-proteobacteria)]MCO5092573.1 type II toxin-antitoxin system VapC family toxin [Bosea sp. (in: a-proteobacteria)]
MFLDASVIVANLLEEPEAPSIRASLVDENEILTSPIAIFEASARLAAVKRFGIDEGYRVVRDFLEDAKIRIVAIDDGVGRIAHACAAAYHHSTRHPARLNMGDCFAYASARAAGMKLAYKGDDFVHTDIEGQRFGS